MRYFAITFNVFGFLGCNIGPKILFHLQKVWTDFD